MKKDREKTGNQGERPRRRRVKIADRGESTIQKEKYQEGSEIIGRKCS